MEDVPEQVVAFYNVEYEDPYTVIFPDGAVFTMSELGHNYLCEWSKFTRTDGDIKVKKVPKPILAQIQKLSV